MSTITNRTLLVTSDLRTVLAERTSELSKAADEQLALMQEGLRAASQARQVAEATRRQSAQRHSEVRRAVSSAIRTARGLTLLLEIPQVVPTPASQPVHLALEQLQQAFALCGELGTRVAVQLRRLGEQYRQSVAALASATEAARASTKAVSVATWRLSAAVGAARAVLQLEGVPLPKAPTRKRLAPPVPALTVPAPLLPARAAAPEPMDKVG